MGGELYGVGDMSFLRKSLKYWVPVFGTRQLLKRIEKLEREVNAQRSESTASLTLYYEARIEALYDAICQRISLDSPVIESGRILLKTHPVPPEATSNHSHTAEAPARI